MLSVCTFNCNSLKNSCVTIAELCTKSDIIFLQETWLSKFELFMLNNIHTDFIGLGVSAFDSSDALLNGRPYGGVAVLWKRSLQSSINVKVISERVMETDIMTNEGVVSLLNVYLPTDYRDSESYDEFCMTLGQLACILDILSAKSNFYGIIGDFNANGRGSTFFTELSEFCTENGLMISDSHFLGAANSTYTYVSAAHGTTSWLDHCVSSPRLHSTIQNISVKYDVCVTDHMPLVIDVMLQPTTFVVMETESRNAPKPSWGTVTVQQVLLYNESVYAELAAVNPYIRNLRNDCVGQCDDESHIQKISACCKALTEAVTISGSHCFEQRQHRLSHTRCLPGWNENVRIRYQAARRAFLHWRSCGSPRENYVALQMRQTRLSFKYALRRCKREQSIFNVNKLAASLLSQEYSRFWVLVKQQLGGGTPIPPSFGAVVGSEDIANMWADHFKAIFNDTSCGSDKDIISHFVNAQSPEVPPITTDEVCSAVGKLKNGKAAGWDNMSNEHLLHLHPDFLSIIATVLNGMLNHGTVPSDIIYSLLKPLVKDKSGALDDRTNYRAVALSTTLSKVLELVLFVRLQPFLKTSDAQFGFKSAHSTTHATFVIKEIVNYYTQRGSPVYACFLDASKAFDRVCHSKLFEILSKRNVPLAYIKLLTHWYTSQTMGVKWASSTSYQFPIANGVRQGGNLSPLLFSVYIDDLLHSLQSAPIGCHIGRRAVNVLAYADDIVLLSPSRAGLQKLVDMCETFALSRDIKFNVKKTVCMVFDPQRSHGHLSGSRSPNITLGGNSLTWVTEFKYLGHIVQCNLSDRGDMRRMKRSLYYSVNMLCALLGNASKEILVKLFRTYCVGFYGCELWDPFRDRKAFRELCVAYHSCLKKMLRLPKSSRNHPLCNAIKILTCPMLVASRQILFFKKLLLSENMIIQAILASDIAQNGITARVHRQLRREYGLMSLDLYSVSRMSINNVFYAHLKRVNGERNRVAP